MNGQFRRAFTLLKKADLVEQDPRCCYLAARCLAKLRDWEQCLAMLGGWDDEEVLSKLDFQVVGLRLCTTHCLECNLYIVLSSSARDQQCQASSVTCRLNLFSGQGPATAVSVQCLAHRLALKQRRLGRKSASMLQCCYCAAGPTMPWRTSRGQHAGTRQPYRLIHSVMRPSRCLPRPVHQCLKKIALNDKKIKRICLAGSHRKPHADQQRGVQACGVPRSQA